jgi:hypothetical protein
MKVIGLERATIRMVEGGEPPAYLQPLCDALYTSARTLVREGNEHYRPLHPEDEGLGFYIVRRVTDRIEKPQYGGKRVLRVWLTGPVPFAYDPGKKGFGTPEHFVTVLPAMSSGGDPFSSDGKVEMREGTPTTFVYTSYIARMADGAEPTKAEDWVIAGREEVA